LIAVLGEVNERKAFFYKSNIFNKITELIEDKQQTERDTKMEEGEVEYSYSAPEDYFHI